MCAQVVGRSKSLILKWSDPDQLRSPNIAEACALDRAFIDAGHGAPPIATLYRNLLEDALSTEIRHAENVKTAALSVQAVVGDLSVAIGEAIRPHRTGRTVVGPRDLAAIREILGRLDDGAETIEDTLDQADKKGGA